MSDYVIGDVQGCFGALVELLAKVGFDRQRDRLFFAGDLVARGTDSLATLRLIYSLKDSAQTVLGNHDLHLLAVHHGVRQPKAKEGIEPILSAPDRDELMHWLQQQPLILRLPNNGILSHAGVPPQWDEHTAFACADEVSRVLKSPNAGAFFAEMYGNSPNHWHDELTGDERLRAITNYLTRMRLLDAHGAMDFQYKGDLSGIPAGWQPWFALPSRLTQRQYFGHWAALLGHTGHEQAVALDTGCVWGQRLCALRLDDGQRIYSTLGQR